MLLGCYAPCSPTTFLQEMKNLLNSVTIVSSVQGYSIIDCYKWTADQKQPSLLNQAALLQTCTSFLAILFIRM